MQRHVSQGTIQNDNQNSHQDSLTFACPQFLCCHWTAEAVEKVYYKYTKHLLRVEDILKRDKKIMAPSSSSSSSLTPIPVLCFSVATRPVKQAAANFSLQTSAAVDLQLLVAETKMIRIRIVRMMMIT